MNGSGTAASIEDDRRGAVSFDSRASGLTPIVVVGVLLSLVTFGIYRFWYMTNLRRYFWSRTLVLDSPGEYVGRGKELFLGFLVALALLVPVYLALFLLTFALPALAPFSGVISFVLLFLLGQYALYRGRRYRASRTLWRGIRLGQDGSAALYALRAAGWWLVTLITLGLAFPFMRAALERYRIDHTLIGATRMRSQARGTDILAPWLLFYAVGLGPSLIALAGFLAANDFAVPTDLLVANPNKAGGLTLNPAYKGTAIALWAVIAAATLTIAVPLTALLVPFYRARETRAFMNAASLESARLVSTLRARQFYWPYILYVLALLGSVAVIGVVFVLAGLGMAAGGGAGTTSLLFGLVGILLYGGMLVAFAVLYVRFVTVGLWNAVATTTTLSDPRALDAVLASARRPGSGLNEGLADALDVGGSLAIGI